MAKGDPNGLTVAQLIVILQGLDPTLPVVGDDHSELGLVVGVEVTEEHYDNGGYISYCYSADDKSRCRPMAYISAQRNGLFPQIPVPGKL